MGLLDNKLTQLRLGDAPITGEARIKQGAIALEELAYGSIVTVADGGYKAFSATTKANHIAGVVVNTVANSIEVYPKTGEGSVLAGTAINLLYAGNVVVKCGVTPTEGKQVYVKDDGSVTDVSTSATIFKGATFTGVNENGLALIRIVA